MVVPHSLSKLPFLFLSNTRASSASKVEVEKVFFSACHAKNDRDWCGGVVKRSVTRDIASGRVTVQNAHDMFRHCQEVLSLTGDSGQCQHKVQQFFLVEPHQISREVQFSMLRTVPGSRKIHNLRALGPGNKAVVLFLFVLHGWSIRIMLVNRPCGCMGHCPDVIFWATCHM